MPRGLCLLEFQFPECRGVPIYLEKINELAAYAREKGYRFYGLTASNSDVVKQLTDLHHIPYEFCSMDEIQLKTIVRSNPGLVLP